MRHLFGYTCVSIFVLTFWFTPASASVIYAVAGDYTGAVPTRLYEIDPDAQTTNILEEFDPVASGLGVMGSIGVGANPGELFVGFATSTTTSLLRSYSISGGSFSDVGAGEPAPIVGIGGTYFGAGGFILGGGNDFYSIDPISGVSTVVGTSPYPFAGDLAQDPTSGTLYAATSNPLLVTVDPSDASMASLGALSDFMIGLAFTQDGRLWGLSSANQLFEIDPSDGSTTFSMNLLGGSFDLASEIALIPEPSTALLLGFGLLALGAGRRH